MTAEYDKQEGEILNRKYDRLEAQEKADALRAAAKQARDFNIFFGTILAILYVNEFYVYAIMWGAVGGGIGHLLGYFPPKSYSDEEDRLLKRYPPGLITQYNA